MESSLIICILSDDESFKLWLEAMRQDYVHWPNDF